MQEEAAPALIINPAIKQKFQEVTKKVAESASRFETRNRVTKTTIVLMLSVAGLYDLLEFLLDLIPFVGWILASFVGVYAWLTFYVWTSIKGWGKTDTIKKWIVQYGLPALGIIPIADIGPELLVSVFLTIAIVKSDDFIYNKTKGRLDIENIRQGLAFFNIFRDVELVEA